MFHFSARLLCQLKNLTTDTKTEEGMSSVAEIADGGNVNLCVSHFSSSPTFDEYIVFGPGTRKLLCNINLIKTL